MGKLLSVVLPCYNEQEVLAETYRQLTVEMEERNLVEAINAS